MASLSYQEIVRIEEIWIQKRDVIVERAQQFVALREKLLRDLSELAGRMDKHQRGVDVSNTTFASVGLASAALILFPPAWPLAAAGAAVSGVGGLGAYIGDSVVSAKQKREADNLIKEDNKNAELLRLALLQMGEYLEEVSNNHPRMPIENILEKVVKGGAKLVRAGKSVKKLIACIQLYRGVATGFNAGRRGAIALSQAAANYTRGALKMGRIGGKALGVVGAAFDVKTLCDSISSLSGGSKSPNAEVVRAQMREIEEELAAIRDLATL